MSKQGPGVEVDLLMKPLRVASTRVTKTLFKYAKTEANEP